VNNLIIVGSSGHAKAVINAIEKGNKYCGRHKITGLIDDYRKPGEKTFDYEVLGRVKDLPQLVANHSSFNIVIAIGDNFGRQKVAEKIKALSPAVQFPSIIHPRCEIGRDISLGEGVYIGPLSLISSNVIIGNLCSLEGPCVLGHDSIMDHFSSLGNNVSIGGNCRIGFGSAVLNGATVIQKIIIGEHTLIGAGATVLKDIPSYVLAVGTPAKVRKERKPGDKYL
jgi:sugar O-acyltransferase (sialic acid O-acetyltransferase NeuD family)